MPQDLPVYLADWNEQAALPTPLMEREVLVRDKWPSEYGVLPRRLQFGEQY